ncbi:MAG: plastocyanin/azurin family copper-binding protein [Chloroflexota bacterium]|nr:plastocyanin/azurin family copper-binding protein [Chloroflexota bacterium]
MTMHMEFLNAALTIRHNRRRAVQAIAGAAGGVLLTKAATNLGGPLAFAQSEDEDNSGRGRGRGRGGDDAIPADNQENLESVLAQTAGVPAGSVEIRIVGDDAGDFVPGDLTVDLGQSITFVNTHSDEHTATGSGFDTGIIAEGGSATVVLDTAGIFAYACLIHPEMTGRVSVRGADGVVPQPQTASAEIPADASAVSIANLAFNPGEITVATGSTVVWTNDDAVPHTVTSVDGVFDSGIFDPGASFSFTFDQPGSLAYVCQLHPQMQGTVIAEGEPAAGIPSAPPQTGDPAPPAPDGSASAATSVSIVDFAFEPATLDVPAGSMVVWTNDGVAPHTVTGDFADSGVLDPGATFSHTFDVTGEYPYSCTIHPQMTAAVSVGSGGGEFAAPATPSATGAVDPRGVWLVTLAPEDETVLAAQQALLTFHADGTVEADFSAAPGNGPPASVLSSAQGEWVVRENMVGLTLLTLVNDANQRFSGTMTIDGHGQITADGQSLEGNFEFAVVSSGGQPTGNGAGTFRGEAMPFDL